MKALLALVVLVAGCATPEPTVYYKPAEQSPEQLAHYAEVKRMQKEMIERPIPKPVVRRYLPEDELEMRVSDLESRARIAELDR
jgi:PBP1b-binding outer membrane lipoprotein LpoB